MSTAADRGTLPASPIDRRVPFGIAGILVGAFVGFALRPSVFLVGQLPFETVIARGADLKGLDQLLMPAAQASFNIMVAGAVVGAVVGAVIGMFMRRQPTHSSEILERVD